MTDHEAPLDNSFMRHGSCVKLIDKGEAVAEHWYPDPGGNATRPQSVEAKKIQVMAEAICNRCPVRKLCLAYALTDPRLRRADNHGIWGGTTQKQRARMVKAEDKRRERAREKEEAEASA